jgi:hypothetical protein
VIEEDYRSGALLLCGDVNGKPPVVIKQHLKHYIVGKNLLKMSRSSIIFPIEKAIEQNLARNPETNREQV